MSDYKTASVDKSIPYLDSDDSRVGWKPLRDNVSFSAACDRFLESRSLPTYRTWIENRLNFKKTNDDNKNNVRNLG